MNRLQRHLIPLLLAGAAAAAALPASAALVHYRISGSKNDFSGDISVNSLDDRIWGAGSQLPAQISGVQRGASVSLPVDATFSNDSGSDVIAFFSALPDRFFYVSGLLPGSLVEDVTSWRDLIADGGTHPFRLVVGLSSGPSSAFTSAPDGNRASITFSSVPVPAPLPLLGALAALACAGRLRRRRREAALAPGRFAPSVDARAFCVKIQRFSTEKSEKGIPVMTPRTSTEVIGAH